MRRFSVSVLGVCGGLVLLAACDAVTGAGQSDEVASVTLDPAAASWDDKVTAGGEATAGGVVFHLSAAASSDDAGAWGEIQYWRDANGGAEALSVHADVDCLNVAEDLSWAALSGPIKSVQEDPAGQFDGATHVLVEFKEGGTGSGDEAGIRRAGAAPGADCGRSGSTPGVYTDGNVNIRSK